MQGLHLLFNVPVTCGGYFKPVFDYEDYDSAFGAHPIGQDGTVDFTETNPVLSDPYTYTLHVHALFAHNGDVTGTASLSVACGSEHGASTIAFHAGLGF